MIGNNLMNARALRRAIDRAKKGGAQPKRQVKPVGQRTPMLHEVKRAFDPLDGLLEQLATGEVECYRGLPVLWDKEDKAYYEAVPALRSFVVAFDMILADHHMNVDSSPLIRLCNKLEAGMPITTDLLDLCVHVTNLYRTAYRKVDAVRAHEIAKKVQIKILVENLGLTA